MSDNTGHASESSSSEPNQVNSPGLVESVGDFQRARAEFEKRFILQALALNNGNISSAAKAMGLARRNLQYKIRMLGIDIESARRLPRSNEGSK